MTLSASWLRVTGWEKDAALPRLPLPLRSPASYFLLPSFLLNKTVSTSAVEEVVPWLTISWIILSKSLTFRSLYFTRYKIQTFEPIFTFPYIATTNIYVFKNLAVLGLGKVLKRIPSYLSKPGSRERREVSWVTWEVYGRVEIRTQVWISQRGFDFAGIKSWAWLIKKRKKKTRQILITMTKLRLLLKFLIFTVFIIQIGKNDSFHHKQKLHEVISSIVILLELIQVDLNTHWA